MYFAPLVHIGIIRNCAAFLLLVACGSGGGSPGTPSPSLKSEADRLTSHVEMCEGWYSRPNCDLGDSMTLAAAMARTAPEAARRQVEASIATDGQPFRSPKHLERYISGDRREDVTSKSFSRDHMISLLFYTVWTGDVAPLSRVWGYATSHNLQICQGPASQCALTPAVLDHIGDAFAYCGKERPWQTHVPGAASALIQLLSIPSIDSWQLTMAAEQVLLKAKTKHINGAWKEVADKVVEKVPTNLYYRYAQAAAYDKASNIGEELLTFMRMWSVPGKEWAWNRAKADSAVGPDLILLASLVNDGL